MTESAQNAVDGMYSRIEAVSSKMMVVHNGYYAKPGQAEAVYQWRLHASDVRAQLGFPPGRVLRRIGDANDQEQVLRPDVRRLAGRAVEGGQIVVHPLAAVDVLGKCEYVVLSLDASTRTMASSIGVYAYADRQPPNHPSRTSDWIS